MSQRSREPGGSKRGLMKKVKNAGERSKKKSSNESGSGSQQSDDQRVQVISDFDSDNSMGSYLEGDELNQINRNIEMEDQEQVLKRRETNVYD